VCDLRLAVNDQRDQPALFIDVAVFGPRIRIHPALSTVCVAGGTLAGMRTIRQHLNYTKVALAVGVFLLAGGVAWAASGSGGAVIHACYSKRSGALRVAGRCKHGEKALSWSQSGPEGREGARGARGETGVSGAGGQNGGEGPAGPSDVYAAGKATGALSLSEYTSYARLALPPGSYLVEATVILFSNKPGTKMVCFVAEASTPVTGELDAAEASAGEKEQNTVALTGALSTTTPVTEELFCKLGAGEGTADNEHLVAIKTGALHGTLPFD
jgi:hypothetical protein